MIALRHWFRARPAPQTASPSRIDPRREELRREVLNLATRDTLSKHGIPSHWITAEIQIAFTSSRQRGMHLRLVLREWRSDLIHYSFALQRAIRARIFCLDPLSAEWLTGISWKFDIVDESACPSLPAVLPRVTPDAPEFQRVDTGMALQTSWGQGDGAAAGSMARGDFSPTLPMGSGTELEAR